MKVAKEWAEQLLLIRDALVEEDVSEAYHQLYLLADAGRGTYEPWNEWEAQAKRNRNAYLSLCSTQSKAAERRGRLGQRRMKMDISTP